MRANYLLLAVFTLYAGLVSAGDIVRVHLKESVEVNGVEFKLGDISDIESNNMRLRNDLANAVIGRSPLVGYKGKFSKALIQSRISYLFPQLGQSVNWYGSDSINVKALGVRLQKNEYVQGAKKYLARQLKGKYKRVQIETVGLYKDVNLPKGELAINYQINNQRYVRKRMQVWADIIVDGHRVVSQPVWFEVSAFGQAWVSKYDLTSGSAIRGNMFVREQLDLASIGRKVLNDLPECCFSRIRKQMSAGDILVQENVETIPAIARGGRVQVLASTKNVQIATQATSLQDGDIGDIVKVQQGRDGIVYNAKVIGRNMLTVDGVNK